jgi:N-acetylmuramoyl-L-alanine amidase
MATLWTPSPNYWQGRPRGKPIAIVIHTMDGTLAGCDSWFQNPDSEVSAHYGVGLDGEVHVYVRTANRAWANGLVEAGSIWPQLDDGNPNDLTVAIETEDLGRPDVQVVTDEQYAEVRTLVRTVWSRYGRGYLLGHNQIAPLSRSGCPGERWWDLRMLELANDTQSVLLSF